MNWINVDEELFEHIGRRIGGTDTAIYGRVTDEMMEGYWPIAGAGPDASQHDVEHSAWYKKAHKIVLSKTLKGTDLPDTVVIGDDVSVRINEIKQEDGAEILVFGSPGATHSLIRQGLIDGYWLFVNPVILGQGIPLFMDIKEKIDLSLLSIRQFFSGVTGLNYTVEG
jgi:dihydrofolate reductase